MGSSLNPCQFPRPCQFTAHDDVNLSVASMRCIVPHKMLHADVRPQSAVIPAVAHPDNGITSCL